MVKILIDTCVWLDIVKDHQQQNFVSVLDELVETKQVELLVPSIILDEFHRNKARILEDSKKSLSGVISRVKEIVDKFGEEEEKQKVLNHLSDIQYKSPILGEYAAQGSINWITTLLENSKIIDLTPAIQLKASRRAIDKKAPFHRNKNNMADAIIFESYVQEMLQKNQGNNRFIFVTHNTDDFSNPVGDKRNCHPDFSFAFSKRKSRYFISLAGALNSVRPKLVSDLLIEREMFSRNPRTLSDILDAENEFVTKVWYNRHQIRKEKIEDGEIKIINDKDFDIKTSQFTITKGIWKGAMASAKKVEIKYGKKNLEWDNFEWGMLNGKLSALRWVLGEEWDELYT